jgi:predicted membrane protein
MGFAFPAMAYENLYLNEIGDENFRSISAMSISMGWGIGELIFIGIGYKWQSWRVQLGIMGITNTVGLVTLLFLKETPLFLLS